MSAIPLPPPPPPDLAALAREVRRLLSRFLHPRRFPKGALLWREGETAGLLVAIRTGRVKIYRLLPTGRAVTLYLFGPEDVFGFLPFLDGGSYPAYAQAIEEVEADVMPRSVLLHALRAEPELAATLIALLGRRLRVAFDLIQGMATPGVKARITAALLPLLPDDPGAPAPVLIELPVTAREFAGAIGVAPETLSRVLTTLTREGILARQGARRYEVLDRGALERTAEPPLD